MRRSWPGRSEGRTRQPGSTSQREDRLEAGSEDVGSRPVRPGSRSLPGGRYPIGGGMTVNLPPGPDGEGVHPHSVRAAGSPARLPHLRGAVRRRPGRDDSAEHLGPGGLRSWPDPPEPHATKDRVRPARSDEVGDRPCPKGQQLITGGFQRTNFARRRRQLHHRVSGRRNKYLEGDGERLHRPRHQPAAGPAHAIAYCARSNKRILTEVASAPAPVAQGANASATTPGCPGGLRLTSHRLHADSRNAFYAGS